MPAYAGRILRGGGYTLALALLYAVLVQQVYAEEKVSFSGYGAVGYRVYEGSVLLDSDRESYYEGQLQADIELNKHVEGQLDFRGSSRSRNLELREFTAKLKFFDAFNLKIGNSKKVFGAEQLLNRFELGSIDRSFINQRLTDLGYGGRAIGITAYNRFTHKDSGDFPASYWITLFQNNSRQSGLLARLSWHVQREVRLSAGFQLIDHDGDEPIGTWAYSADISYETKAWSAELEGFVAQDPIESLRRRVLGNAEKAEALGLRLAASVRFELGGEIFRSLEPVLLLGWYAPDADNTAARTLQALSALNLYVHKKARLRAQVDILDTTSPYSAESTSIGSSFTLEFQLRF